MKVCDLEMEKCLLGCMVMDKSIIPNVTAQINETDLYSETNRAILRSIVSLDNHKKAIDLLTLNTETKYKYVEDVTTIMDSVPTSSNWAYYADKVKRYSMLRETNKIRSTLEDLTIENIGEKLSEIMTTTNKINENNGGNDIKPVYDFMLPLLNEIDKAYHNKGMLSGFDTGFDKLNCILDGIQNELYIIGARPSIGKSALAVNLAVNLAKKGKKVGYFSLEMSSLSLVMRAMSDISSVQAIVMKKGMVDLAGYQRIQDKLMELGNLPIYITDDSDGNINKICAKARYMVRCLGVEVIFIDYISLISHYNQRIPRHEQFAEIAVILQKLKKELNIPIIQIAQLTRDTEGKRPSIKDIRESGAFEQTADCIILLDRERAASIDDVSIETDAIIVKNRNGACGTAYLKFLPQYIRFIDDRRQDAEILEERKERERKRKEQEKADAQEFKKRTGR
jgi:replicative DNA helicase